ncbi:MAG: energy transducer TonB, partial [Parachlamydiaceae bacterium]
KKEPVIETPKVDPQAEALKQRKRALKDQARSYSSKVDTNSSRLKGGSSLDSISLPSQLGELKIDNLAISTESSLSVRERGYRDELASRLKLTLKLPEYGVVKLKLTLNRLGKVTDVTIVQSESAGNKGHIKKALPSISFPPFGDNFIGHETYTFQITLNSE